MIWCLLDWIWRICNITFKNGIVPEGWRSAVIVPLYKGKGERTECKNYRGISLLSLVAVILVDRVCRATKGLVDDEQGWFQIREGMCRSNLHTKTNW